MFKKFLAATVITVAVAACHPVYAKTPLTPLQREFCGGLSEMGVAIKELQLKGEYSKNELTKFIGSRVAHLGNNAYYSFVSEGMVEAAFDKRANESTKDFSYKQKLDVFKNSVYNTCEENINLLLSN